MILKELMRNKNARKIFGKREIEIILKQLDGIQLTQSEKNRLSRDIRKKLDFIKEISQFQDEFSLKKDANTKRIVDKAVRLILNDELKDKVRAILLFGSHADKSATKKSDIDIGVIFDNILLKQATKFRIRITSELPEKADIQVVNILSQKVKRDIARNHKVLFKNEGFDNISFTIKFLKDEDFFIRKERIFGEVA